MLSPAVFATGLLDLLDVFLGVGIPAALLALLGSAVAKNHQPRRGPSRLRQLAGALLFAMICYPLSAGPFGYAVARGWVPPQIIGAGSVFYLQAPIALNRDLLGRDGHPLGERWLEWHYEFFCLGARHAKQR